MYQNKRSNSRLGYSVHMEMQYVTLVPTWRAEQEMGIDLK